MENFTRRKSRTFNWSETKTLPPTNIATTIPTCKLKPNLQSSSNDRDHHHHHTTHDHPKISKRVERWNFGESGKSILFLLLSVFLTGVLSQENNLTIVPSSKNRVYQRALGKSSIFTCTANVSDPEKLTEFRWWWPDGRIIEATDNRVEIMRDHTGNSLTLLFTSIQEQDLGMYKCTAVYDNKEQLATDFTLRAYVPITFEDAPTNQYAVKGQDYKVRCQVKADPEPQVDWKKDHRVINNSDHFFMDKDGVVIRGVTEDDEGIYTCRVRVTSMGTVEERHIQVEVHQHPKITSEPEEIEGVEDEAVTLHCSATGKPVPEYDWVNHKHQDLRHTERHTVDKYKGTLTIEGIQREDAGVYTCTARNNAGYVTMKSTLNVVTKPVIEEFKNIKTQINGNSVLTCRASGDPAPEIKFQKDGSREAINVGAQKDSRLFMDMKKDGRNTVATLKISDVLRTDDGLYKCLAFNQRTKTETTAHLTVEFPPTFVNSPMREAWSWDGRAVNVTCLAEAIPNATISWFIEGTPERKITGNMAGIKQHGSKSESSLEITPTNKALFGYYKCVATNKLGTAEHRVHLREARKPGPILEAIVHEKTATTITYKIVGPRDDGGLAVKNFVAQYKEDRVSWEEHKLQSWPVDQQFFTIEGLEPLRTYFVRFAAENDVGLGDWALEKAESTPRRSAPEIPVIMNEINGHSAAITAYPDKFELIWKVPADNGEKIERFEISYQQVRNTSVVKGNQVELQWEDVGSKVEENKNMGEPRYIIKNLNPGTYYKVELRARNKIGASGPAEIIIKTAAVPGGSYDQIQSSKSESAPTSTTTADFQIPMMIILFAVGSAVVILLLIDISCYRINQTGLIWTIFSGMCNKKRSRESLVKDATPNEKKPLKEDTPDVIVVTDQSPSPTKPSNDQSSNNGNNHGNGSTNNINITHHTHPEHQQHNVNNSHV